MQRSVAGVGGEEEVFLQPGLSLRGIRARQFAHHEKGVARLNNGSFGSCPASVQAAQAEWKAQAIEQPDAFLNEQLEGSLKESRAAVAEMINAPSVDEVVLLDNVTTAVAMLAHDLAWSFVEGRFQKGDAVLLLDLAYNAVKTCFEAIVARAGGRLIYAKIPFPVSSPSEVLDCFRESLHRMKEEDSRVVIRFAVIDHISSMPAMVLPVREMVSLARSHGVEQILVDGAHAFGSVDVNVQEIDADYYTSNLHKWFFTPSSVAFFHCKRQHLLRLHHPIVSTTHGKGLAAECAWVGTRDYSAQLTIPWAIDYVNELGGIEVVRQFNHNRVVAMGEMLALEWGTSLGVPPEMAPSMVMVGLPPVLNIRSSEGRLELEKLLRQEFHIEVPIHCVPHKDKPLVDPVVQIPNLTAYVRVSHQIYNTVKDYHCLRDAVKLLVRTRWTPDFPGDDEEPNELQVRQGL